MDTSWPLAGGQGPNRVLHGEGFFISYVTHNEVEPLVADNPIVMLGAAIIGGGRVVDGDEETAIVKDGEYFILNGDWRPEYTALVPKGFDACKKFFEEHIEFKSSWSN